MELKDNSSESPLATDRSSLVTNFLIFLGLELSEGSQEEVLLVMDASFVLL